MEVLELKLALAKEKLESAKKDVDNINLQIELFKKNFCENNTTNNYEIFDTNIEIFDTNIGSGDDYFTFPSTASISDVVKNVLKLVPIFLSQNLDVSFILDHLLLKSVIVNMKL